MMLAGVANELGKDVGRNARLLRRKILTLQASFNAVDNCRKPVSRPFRVIAWAAPST
jgi:enoyl-CoA hydratase